MNHQVDTYLDNLNKWKKELARLRQIIANCGLNEEFKWMHPCYTYNKKNIVLIHEFKDYCAILFHKGALLKDAKNILGTTYNITPKRELQKIRYEFNRDLLSSYMLIINSFNCDTVG